MKTEIKSNIQLGNPEKEGYEAFINGVVLSGNPYSVNDPYYLIWSDGWWNAKKHRDCVQRDSYHKIEKYKELLLNIQNSISDNGCDTCEYILDLINNAQL